MNQYFLKADKGSLILYLSPFYWRDVYRIIAPHYGVDVKMLTTFAPGVKRGFLSVEEIRTNLIYKDNSFVHPVLTPLIFVQPLSKIRKLIDDNKLDVYEYDIYADCINIYSYYHDDVVLEFSYNTEYRTAIVELFQRLKIGEEIPDKLIKNQNKVITVDNNRIKIGRKKIEDIFAYLNDQYYVKYPECYVPGRAF